MNKKDNKNFKILYVEDDDIARENGIEYLQNYFEYIYEASDALNALKIYKEIKPDIIISDIQMPKLNGLEFIEEIRKKDLSTQIIVISAFSDKSYLLKAIELKLVKYLIKPVKESDLNNALSLCINSIKQRTSNIINLNHNTYFDMFNNTLLSNNEIVQLRTKELSLLTLLLKNKNRYVTYVELENIIWEDSVMTKDALKTLVKNLKMKLPKNLIKNLTGTGYKIEL